MKHIIKILYIGTMIAINLPSLIISVFWTVMYWDWTPVNSCMIHMEKIIQDSNSL